MAGTISSIDQPCPVWSKNGQVGQKRRSWNYRSQPLGHIVGIPSLWPRPGGVLQQHRLGVIRSDERKALVPLADLPGVIFHKVTLLSGLPTIREEISLLYLRTAAQTWFLFVAGIFGHNRWAHANFEITVGCCEPSGVNDPATLSSAVRQTLHQRPWPSLNHVATASA